MQCLSDSLASCLERVRSLEAGNQRWRLESKIRRTTGQRLGALLQDQRQIRLQGGAAVHEEPRRGSKWSDCQLFADWGVGSPPPQSQDRSKIIAESRTSGSEEPKELDEYWPQQIEEGITPQRPLR